MKTGPIQSMKAADIMTRDVVCLNEELGIHDCEKIMLEKGISGAPVVDLEGELRGVVSKTDLVSYHHSQSDEEVSETDFYRLEDVRGAHVVDFNTPAARDVMTPVPCVASESTSLEELAGLMVRRQVHRVVICRGRKVVGIVSSMDVLRAIASGSGQPGAEPKPGGSHKV